MYSAMILVIFNFAGWNTLPVCFVTTSPISRCRLIHSSSQRLKPTLLSCFWHLAFLGLD